ncbi:hypothetical protein BDP27DRAFT_324783 [Rhodocollybia butyracea]|uniref:Uncharacterized protein n=1 Tax=Rhodocollybia butyracea TaxID=206335 RepID=A0A9P5PDZ0_9AGAR|nr:hypothetical protein BDP27DRAFT_324783 [Rhodocollybia butyracea]
MTVKLMQIKRLSPNIYSLHDKFLTTLSLSFCSNALPFNPRPCCFPGSLRPLRSPVQPTQPTQPNYLSLWPSLITYVESALPALRMFPNSSDGNHCIIFSYHGSPSNGWIKFQPVTQIANPAGGYRTCHLLVDRSLESPHPSRMTTPPKTRILKEVSFGRSHRTNAVKLSWKSCWEYLV